MICWWFKLDFVLNVTLIAIFCLQTTNYMLKIRRLTVKNQNMMTEVRKVIMWQTELSFYFGKNRLPFMSLYQYLDLYHVDLITTSLNNKFETYVSPFHRKILSSRCYIGRESSVSCFSFPFQRSCKNIRGILAKPFL